MILTLSPISEVSRFDLIDFDCGVDALNLYLTRFALKNDKLGIGKTFVALSESGKVVGYFTLSTAQVRFA